MLEPALSSPATSPASEEAYAAQWRSDRLDLGAYLRRIGMSLPVLADGATLARLHRAHIAAIPFENLDVILGRGVSVDLPQVEAKLVHRSRGGYCYEHATLFGAVLERVGFRVDRVLARTGDPLEHPRPRSHMVLLAARPETGERWLADVGFGSGLLHPLALTADGPHRQGSWIYELVRGPGGRDTAWRLREHDGTRWTTVLTFTEEPQYPVDVEVANHNTSTSPGSPFTQRPVVVLKDQARVRRLLGREWSVDRPGEQTARRMLDDGEVAQVLGEVFGDAMSADEIEAVVATLAPPERGVAGSAGSSPAQHQTDARVAARGQR